MRLHREKSEIRPLGVLPVEVPFRQQKVKRVVEQRNVKGQVHMPVQVDPLGLHNAGETFERAVGRYGHSSPSGQMAARSAGVWNVVWFRPRRLYQRHPTAITTPDHSA